MEYFFTSDTHFCHNKILKYQPDTRGHFKSIEEHDEYLVQEWNKLVKPRDTVFHLGDFCFGSKEKCLKAKKCLNGHIAIILGNHDAGTWQIRKKFIWYDHVKLIKIKDQEIFLSHYAHLTWPKSHYNVWHFFGHSHSSLNPWINDHLPNNKMIDVGVDNWNLKPVHFDVLKKIMDSKSFVSIDHH